MYKLNIVEIAEVSGGGAGMSFNHDGGVVFTTTGTSKNAIYSQVNGIQFNMTMYADHITDISNNIIFEGTSGSFCHNGNLFVVSPVTGGSSVTFSKKC